MWRKGLRASVLVGVVASLLLGGAAFAQGGATIGVATNAKLGQILVNSSGMTLYAFTKDKGGTSACYGVCAKIWPALTVTGTPTLAPGLTGTVGVSKRTDGSEQVTYNGMPVYTFSGDKAAGQTNGQGFKNLWYVIHPGATTVTAATAPSGGATGGSAPKLPKTGSDPLFGILGAALAATGVGMLLRRPRRTR